jgi:nitroreductase
MTRASVPAKQLTDPAPDGSDLDTILEAAVRAPDHGTLRPWRFVLIRGPARERLGDVLAEAFRRREPEVDQALVERQRSKPLRSPLIVTVVAHVDRAHPKVPEIEQVLATGAAIENMLLAAHALGYGAIWLTGNGAYDRSVADALGLALDERIVGFVYLGTPSGEPPSPERPDPRSLSREWLEPAPPAEPDI